MIRLVLFLVALWSLSGLHGVYRSHTQAGVITGQQAQSMQPGRVTVTGVVDAGRVKADGTALLNLVCQGMPVTVYAGPLVGLVPPLPGTSIQVTGKLIKPGMVALEHVEDLAALRTELAGGQRVELDALTIADMGLTRSGGYRRLRITLPAGEATSQVLVPTAYAALLPDQGRLIGRRLPSGFVIVDRIL